MKGRDLVDRALADDGADAPRGGSEGSQGTRSRRAMDADTSRERGTGRAGRVRAPGRPDRRRELAGELLEAAPAASGTQVVVDERGLRARIGPSHDSRRTLRWWLTVGWATSQHAVEVTRADAAARRELAEDREAGRVGGALEEERCRGRSNAFHFPALY
mgnify:CR=1 FL=1